jgi:hypothetical protein
MTEQQLTALSFPCVEAMDTTNPRFYWSVADWHVCLTVNVGFE